jgi:hypothetical protein
MQLTSTLSSMSPVYVVYIYSYYLRIQLQPYVGNVSYYWLVCFWTDQRGSKWAHLQRVDAFWTQFLSVGTDTNNGYMSHACAPFTAETHFLTTKNYHALISKERERFYLYGQEWPAHGSTLRIHILDAYLLRVCVWTDDAVILHLAAETRFLSVRRKRTLLVRLNHPVGDAVTRLIDVNFAENK